MRGVTDPAARSLVERECLLSLLFTGWDDIAHLSFSLSGAQFTDPGLGELYDLIVDARSTEPDVTAFELLVDPRLDGNAAWTLAWVLREDRSRVSPDADCFERLVSVVRASSIPAPHLVEAA